MMQVARTIGGAGTGKTARALQLMDDVISRGVDPMEVGFVSFTRAARREAAERAADRVGIPAKTLQQSGWFRTLHSVCFNCMGIDKKQMLTGDKESAEWLENALQRKVSMKVKEDSDLDEFWSTSATDADMALSIWSLARNRLQPLEEAWDSVRESYNYQKPNYKFCEDLVTRYEQQKYLEDRLDFVDLLSSYAGYKFTIDGPEEIDPVGEIPQVRVWIHDEMQDSSGLLGEVFRRIILGRYCQWVYLFGDPFQAIHTYAGSDPAVFRQWHADKEQIMPRSWRCGEKILKFGEEILLGCSDYFDRKIQAASHTSSIEDEPIYPQMPLYFVDPSDDWLILARTNFLAGRLSILLKEAGVPHRSTKGGHNWVGPRESAIINACDALGQGYTISLDEFKRIHKVVPIKSNGEVYFERGTKAMVKNNSAKELGLADLQNIHEWGGTEDFVNLIRSGKWKRYVKRADTYLQARDKWGQDVVDNPPVRIGTIHSAKGAEADNVMLLTTINCDIEESMRYPDGNDAERRVAYVGVTRARKRLIIGRETRGRQWEMF